MKILSFALLGSLLLIGCSAAKRINSYTESDILFMIEKTACFGECPVYQFTIYNNGKAKLTGFDNIDYIGDYYGKANLDQVNKLIEHFENKEIVSYKESPKKRLITDAPTTIYFARINEELIKIKRVSEYPEAFRKLEKDSNKILESITWQEMKQ